MRSGSASACTAHPAADNIKPLALSIDDGSGHPQIYLPISTTVTRTILGHRHDHLEMLAQDGSVVKGMIIEKNKKLYWKPEGGDEKPVTTKFVSNRLALRDEPLVKNGRMSSSCRAHSISLDQNHSTGNRHANSPSSEAR